MDERELSLAVVGINHPNEDRRKTSRRFEVEISTPGEPVTFRFEPKNPHDPQAIAVDSARGIQIGYIRAEQNAWIGGKIRNETYEVVFQEPRPTCAVVRIRFGGGAPTLPPPRPPRPPMPDETSQVSREWDNFYPDAPADDFSPDDSFDGVDPDGPEWGA
jgi:hypothetical protein